MKIIIWIIVIVILVIFFGTFPFSVLEIIFNFLGKCFGWLAGVFDFFGWNGLI